MSRTVSIWFLLATGVQFVIGFWFLFALPRDFMLLFMGGRLVGTIALGPGDRAPPSHSAGACAFRPGTGACYNSHRFYC